MLLLKKNAVLVQAQIGLITIDEAVQSLFEPQAGSPLRRLQQMTELVDAGIPTSVRLDPILPGLTDSEPSLREVCSAVARTGITRLAAGTLFLRSAVVSSLRLKIPKKSAILDSLLDAFREAKPVKLRGGDSSIRALPAETRRAIFQRVQRIAAEYGLTARICACKNPDIAAGTCQIAGQRVAGNQIGNQLDLFKRG